MTWWWRWRERDNGAVEMLQVRLVLPLCPYRSQIISFFVMFSS